VQITAIKVLFFNFLIFNLKVVVAQEGNVMGENPNSSFVIVERHQEKL
jgi:hypothetical protein